MKSENKSIKNDNVFFSTTTLTYITKYIDQVVQNINTSKIFAGIMIIILNIGSKFVNIKLSKSMEGYLKYTFSKQILVFAMAWMGTRDVYIALVITVLFTILNEYIFNEQSKYCCLSETFTNYHLDKLVNEGMENKEITQEDIDKATLILEKAKKQQIIDEEKIENNMIDVNHISSSSIVTTTENMTPMFPDSSMSFSGISIHN
jgi:hypothetical protein